MKNVSFGGSPPPIPCTMKTRVLFNFYNGDECSSFTPSCESQPPHWSSIRQANFFFDLCQKGFGLIVLCKNVGRSNRKSSQGQIITKKMDVCRWQVSWIVGFLLFLSNVIGDFDKRDYLKREHTLVKPYSGYLFFSIVKTYKTLNYVRS